MKRKYLKTILFTIFLPVLIFCCTALFSRLYAESRNTLYAGTAKINITPETPVPMSGYGNKEEPYKEIHDELFARVIVFSDGERKSAIISADLIGLSHSFCNEVRERIEKETGILQTHILLCATHTHGGPSTGAYSSPAGVSDYVKGLKEKLISAVKSADSRLEPVSIGAGKGECKMNINRRARTSAGGIWLGKNPYGPCDHEVGAVIIRKTGGSPAAVFVNWPCHGVIMGPKNNYITADWPGAASRYIENQYQDKIIAPVTAGASGDIAPLYNKVVNFGGRIGEVEITGTMVGEEALKAVKEVKTYSSGSINISERLITLPGKKSGELSDASKDEPAPDVTIRLSVLKVGTIIFAGISGELMTEIGMKVKRLSPYKSTFILTHCNGSSGYIITDDAYGQGGYETVTSRIKSGAEKAVISNLLDMINEF